MTRDPSAGLYNGGWLYETGQPRIRVGIVDSGIRNSHQDMGPGVVVGGWNYGNNVPLSTYAYGHSHGTSVAGIIGATTLSVLPALLGVIIRLRAQGCDFTI
jgi:hypothetical protein